MKLLLDDKGNAVIRNGMPVYVMNDGKEVEFDAPATVGTIARLNGEAKTNRERAEGVEKTLKAFTDAGITDPKAASEALNTVSKLDQKRLIDAGKVDEVRNEVNKAWETKYAEATAKIETQGKQIYAEKVGGAFSRSTYIKEKLLIPADMAQSRFGNAFTIDEQGRTVAKDENGNMIYSAARPGEPADFDEALSTLVSRYPHRDNITRGTNAAGGGASSSQQNTGGKKVVSRADYEKMDAASQRETASLMGQGKATIVD